MFIPVLTARGTKIYEKPEGMAADFCPICRKAVGVQVGQLRAQAHINYVGFGEGELVSRICTCLECRSVWPLAPESIRCVLNPTGNITIETLLAETYPDFKGKNAERLEWERILQQAPTALAPDIRARLLAEPFEILDYDFRKRTKDLTSAQNLNLGAGCLGATFLLLIGLVCLFSHAVIAGIVCVLSSLGLIQLALKMSAASSRQFLEQRIYPRLVSALAPLRPTHDELSALIAANQGSESQPGLKIWKLAKLDRLMSLLEAAPKRTPAR